MSGNFIVNNIKLIQLHTLFKEVKLRKTVLNIHC